MTVMDANNCRSWAKLAVALCFLAGAPAVAQQAAPAVSVQARDGSHDFDFDIGVWHTHIRRILDPFAGGQHSIDLDGTVTVRKVWGGRASLEEIEVDGPSGHWEGMNLFLYNPEAHQWSQFYSNARAGMIGAPFVGDFRNGRGELISTDTLDNRAVLVRAVWSDITANTHDYSEYYSNDGGATWRLSFAAHLNRAVS